MHGQPHIRFIDSYLTAEEYLTIETEYLLPHSKQSVIGWPSLITIPIQNPQLVTPDTLTGAVSAILRCLRCGSRRSGHLKRNATSLLVQATRPTGIRLVDQHLCLVRHDICAQNSHTPPKKSVSTHNFATETRESSQKSEIWRLTRFSWGMSLKNWANKKDQAHVADSDNSHRLLWRYWNRFHLQMNHGSIRAH